jgi:hypothetical protein
MKGKDHDPRFFDTIKKIVFLLCALWGFGLAAKLTMGFLEFSKVVIPRSFLNIYLDTVPLLLFSVLSVAFFTWDFGKALRKKRRRR